MMNDSDARKIINRLLSSVADIAERDVKLFHFDGELFHPNIGKPVPVYELRDIRLVDEEPIVNEVCLGPTCLDGTPDMRYNHHNWRREEWYSYDLIHGEDKFTRILVGAANSRHEIDIAVQSFHKFAATLRNQDFAEAYRATIKVVRDTVAIYDSILALDKRLRSLRSLIDDVVKSFEYLNDTDKRRVDEARRQEALIQADRKARLEHAASQEDQIAIKTEQLRNQFRALSDAVSAEEVKRRIAAMTDLITVDP